MQIASVYKKESCDMHIIANFYKQKMNVSFVQLKLYKQSVFFSIQEFCLKVRETVIPPFQIIVPDN